MKVLVTAFKPFNKENINYSMETLNYLNNVDNIILDVIYDQCYLDLNESFNLEEYDLIIALGEARMRNELTLEYQAKNISSCSLMDNGGNLKKDEVIDNNYPEIITTKVNLDSVEDIVKISYDAGKFVCNNLYFHLLCNYPDKSLFIHVPNCNNDVNQYKENADKITLIINKIIK